MTTSSGDGTALPPDIARSVAQCVTDLERQAFTRRIYEHDATLWRGNEEESRRRLGWLHVCATMAPQSAQVVAFADAVRRGGFRHVVLLGMGGSSLGSEVLNRVVGGRPGFPALHVLDSTVPGSVNAVRNTIDLERTLFIVSSKSGSTLEPNLLLEYFLHEVSARAGEESGKQFIAITDPGSSLEKTARERAFRQVFLNPTEIGGRYSVLSLFGLVPAALIGIDIDRLMAGAARTTEQCRPAVATGDNPGVQLGAYIAACTRLGRDKLTFLTSPGLRSFGLWAEQLIAESTGKEGQGVVPIMGEPSLTLTMYADDRAFVYLRLEGDENAETDRLQRQLADAGFPCLTLNGEDTYSLGGEFYRWEYATAVVGTLLGINPFDQPDVQRAKDASTKVLEHYLRNGALPEVEPTHTPEGLLSTVRPATTSASSRTSTSGRIRMPCSHDSASASLPTCASAPPSATDHVICTRQGSCTKADPTSASCFR
jgi:glucose-6-phosphate isomerase